MRIVIFVLSVLFIQEIISIFRKRTKILNSKVMLTRDIELYKIEYTEDKVLAHLDYLIKESIDYYMAMEIIPKDIYYINTSIETKMRDYIIDRVTDRISPALYLKLSLIYSKESMTKVIGERIAVMLMNSVITFNVNNEGLESLNKKIITK